LSVSNIDGRVSWYRNDQQVPPTFEKIDIPGPERLSDWPMDIVAADVDRDGDLDVLVASRLDKEISWYENDSAPLPGFAQHVLTNEADGTHGVIAADLDGDNDLDVAYVSQFDGVVGWFENQLSLPVDILGLERDDPTYGDSTVHIHWYTDTDVAGTAVSFELWTGHSQIADLGIAWNPDGENIAEIRLPIVAERSDYRIVVRSIWDPILLFSSEPFAILGGPMRLDLLEESVLWETGSMQPVYWRSNPQISGTAVNLGLWDATQIVTDFGTAWAAQGEGSRWITVPDVPSGDQYRMRAVSIWDSQYSVSVQTGSRSSETNDATPSNPRAGCSTNSNPLLHRATEFTIAHPPLSTIGAKPERGSSVNTFDSGLNHLSRVMIGIKIRNPPRDLF
jgi:hypothetical protein